MKGAYGASNNEGDLLPVVIDEENVDGIQLGCEPAGIHLRGNVEKGERE